MNDDERLENLASDLADVIDDSHLSKRYATEILDRSTNVIELHDWDEGRDVKITVEWL